MLQFNKVVYNEKYIENLKPPEDPFDLTRLIAISILEIFYI